VRRDIGIDGVTVRKLDRLTTPRLSSAPKAMGTPELFAEVSPNKKRIPCRA